MRRLAAIAALALVILTGLWLLRRDTGVSPDRRAQVIVATLRSEPRTFNRLFAADRASLVVSQLLHDGLVRVNHATQALEPALAESWDESDDGTRYTVKLRPDIRFSDGSPVTAEDVVFSLAAVYEPKLSSPLADSLTIQGKPVVARALDAHTVELTFPAPFGPGLRPLHAVPILSRAKSAGAEDGSLRAAWAVDASPGTLIGAGPFMLERHEPGVAIHLVRNPHYWRTADGTPLPRVDRLRIDIVPSQDAEMLRLRNGEADLTSAELRSDDLPEARDLATQGRLRLFDLGPGLDADMLWFNLAPGAPGGERRAWLRSRELREAVARAVDRTAFINAVYRGAGVQASTPIAPGNRAWHAEDIVARPYSPEQAGEFLDRINVRDRDGDGVREDMYGKPASFTLLVQQGHTVRQRAAAVLQESLRAIGLQMEIVNLDPAGLQQRLGTGQYEAMYHSLPATDTDPSSVMEFWLSSGHFHLWNPGQEKPATTWEAEIDVLMTRQMTLTNQEERRRLVARAQHLLDAELPVLIFAVPRVTVATSARLTDVSPGLLSPAILWDAASLGVR